MLFTVYIIFIILGIFIPKSTKLTVVIFCFGWILMGLNTFNIDYPNYEKAYDTVGKYARISSTLEMGYYYISYFFKQFGADYLTFKAILCAFCLYIYYKFILKYSSRPSLVAAIFLAAVLPRETVQVRFFYASSLMLVVYDVLIRSTSSRKIYMAAMLTIVASTIHTSSIFYLSIICTYIDFKRISFAKKIITLILFSLIVVAAFLFAVNTSRLEMLSSESYVGTSFVASLFFQCVTVGLFVLIFFSLKKHVVKTDYQAFVSRMNYAILLFVPFFLLTTSFGRFIRYFIFFYIIYYSNVISHKSKFKPLLITLSLGVLALMLSYAMYIGSFWNEYNNIFDNNVLLDKQINHTRN